MLAISFGSIGTCFYLDDNRGLNWSYENDCRPFLQFRNGVPFAGGGPRRRTSHHPAQSGQRARRPTRPASRDPLRDAPQLYGKAIVSVRSRIHSIWRVL